jgi:hypothetical protein
MSLPLFLRPSKALFQITYVNVHGFTSFAIRDGGLFDVDILDQGG